MGKSVCSNLIFRFRIAHLICCISICKSFFYEHYFRNYNACLGICAKKALRRVLLLKASTSPAAEQPLRGVQCPSTRRGSGEERPMRGRTVGLFSLASGKMTRCTSPVIIIIKISNACNDHG